jgi:hypothetical protein
MVGWFLSKIIWPQNFKSPSLSESCLYWSDL